MLAGGVLGLAVMATESEQVPDTAYGLQVFANVDAIVDEKRRESHGISRLGCHMV